MWGVVAASVAFTSCKKQLDINTDPNNPNLDQLTSKLVFPAGVASSIGRIGGHLAIVGGVWSQYYTQSVVSNQYKDIDSYNLTKGFGSTNTGVNPARSIGPAIFVGGWAIEQLWLFIVAPVVGAVLGAFAYKAVVAD